MGINNNSMGGRVFQLCGLNTDSMGQKCNYGCLEAAII